MWAKRIIELKKYVKQSKSTYRLTGITNRPIVKYVSRVALM